MKKKIIKKCIKVMQKERKQSAKDNNVDKHDTACEILSDLYTYLARYIETK